MKSIAYIPASNGAGNANQMTVQNVRSAGASDIIVNTVTGVPTKFYGSMGAPHTFTDPVTSETITIISEATAVDFAGHIDTGKVVIDAIAPGYVDTRGSLVGDIVVVRPVTEWANNLFNVLSQSLDDDGTIKGAVLPSIGDHVSNGGGIWAAVSGLNASMTALAGWQANKQGTIAALASRTFTASKDTYIDVLRNTTTNAFSLVYTEVANGAAAPALAANSFRLAKVVTGATVTSVVQTGWDSLFNTIYPNAPISPAQISVNGLYSDGYSASGQGAAGEFSSPTRKNYDVTAVPTGHLFFVYARCHAGDGAGFRNVNVSVSYNGFSFGQDVMTQYHQGSTVSQVFRKVAGVNTVSVQMGGSAGSQTWDTTLQQLN